MNEIDHSRPRLMSLKHLSRQDHRPLLVDLETYSAVLQQKTQRVVINKARQSVSESGMQTGRGKAMEKFKNRGF